MAEVAVLPKDGLGAAVTMFVKDQIGGQNA